MAASSTDPALDNGYDTDSVSVTSTVESEWTEDARYLVEDILAERAEDDGDTSYLIKWDGYEMHR
jgi:chromo domain-containing protein 1